MGVREASGKGENAGWSDEEAAEAACMAALRDADMPAGASEKKKIPSSIAVYWRQNIKQSVFAPRSPSMKLSFNAHQRFFFK